SAELADQLPVRDQARRRVRLGEADRGHMAGEGADFAVDPVEVEGGRRMHPARRIRRRRHADHRDLAMLAVDVDEASRMHVAMEYQLGAFARDDLEELRRLDKT